MPDTISKLKRSINKGFRDFRKMPAKVPIHIVPGQFHFGLIENLVAIIKLDQFPQVHKTYFAGYPLGLLHIMCYN